MEKPKGHSQRPVSREAPKGVKGGGVAIYKFTGCESWYYKMRTFISTGMARPRFFYQNERKYCISNGQWIDGFFLHIHLTPIKPMSDEDGLTSEKFYEDNAKDLRKVKY